MRRILYIITELDVGGAEKALYELATRLDRRRFEPVVACLTGRGAIAEWLEREGVQVRYVDMRGWWDIPAWVRLRRTLKEERPGVVHAFLFHANVAGKLAAMGLGIKPVICSVRVEEPRWRHLWAERLTRGLADIVTCVSESARRHTHERMKVPLAQLVAVPNGIDPEQCDVSVLAAPEEWALPDGAPVVAVIGRLDEQKDPLLMLRAAARVARDVPDAVFAFAGDGPLRGRCEEEGRRLGVDRNVRWLGWIEDTKPLLARMDLLAVSSKWEGMPNVVLEAMACRKPVVATEVGGCPELVESGTTGLLAPWDDEEALAARMIELLRDPDLRTRYGRAGRERVERCFSMEAMVAANERLYE